MVNGELVQDARHSVEHTRQAMGVTVYLQRFEQGKDVSVPFDPVLTFLARFAERYDPSGDVVIFPPGEVAEDARVVGSQTEGALCIAFHRPIIDDQFRGIVFEAMQQFGLHVYDNACDFLYVLSGSSEGIPPALSGEFSEGVREVTHPAHLWPDRPQRG